MAGTLLGTLAPAYLSKIGRPTVYIGGDQGAWTDAKTKIILPTKFCGQEVEGDIALGLVAHEIGHWFQNTQAERAWLAGRPDFAKPAVNVLLDVALETAITNRIPSIRFALQAISAVAKIEVDAQRDTAPAHPFNDLLFARFDKWPGRTGNDQAGKLIALAKEFGKRRLSVASVMTEFLDKAAKIAPELFENPPAPEKAEDAEDDKDGEEGDGETETKPGDSDENTAEDGGGDDDEKQDEKSNDETQDGSDSGEDDDSGSAEGDSGEDTDGTSDDESDDQDADGEDESDEGGEDGESDAGGQGQGQGESDDGADADASGSEDAGEPSDRGVLGLSDILSAGLASIIAEIAADPTPLGDAVFEVLTSQENNVYGDAPVNEPAWATPPRSEPWPETRQIAAKVSTSFARPNIRSTGLGTGSIDRRAIARGESPHVAVLSVKRGRGKAQDVVLCVDGSSSMKYGGKWELAARAAEVIFLALKRESENEAVIYVFNDRLIRPVNPSSIDLLHAGLPGGGTTGSWIEGIWREYPHHTVIIITDGEMYGVPQGASTFDKRRTAVIGIGTDARTMEPCADRVQRANRLEDLPGMMAGLIPQGYYA